MFILFVRPSLSIDVAVDEISAYFSFSDLHAVSPGSIGSPVGQTLKADPSLPDSSLKADPSFTDSTAFLIDNSKHDSGIGKFVFLQIGLSVIRFVHCFWLPCRSVCKFFRQSVGLKQLSFVSNF